MTTLAIAATARKAAADELLCAVQRSIVDDQEFSIGRALRMAILPEPTGSEWTEILDRFEEKR